MSMGLGEKKKIKSEPVDQKEEKPSSQEAITTTSSSPLPTPSTFNQRYLIRIEIMPCLK